MTLTEWYPPNIKPKRRGVYITRHANGIYFQRWTGTFWNVRHATIETADKAILRSRFQDVEWKGIKK